MRNLNSLATFVQVAKHESVTKAANHMHLTQQAVSHQIKKLEDELGVLLFKRAHRKIYLTQEGRCLLMTAEKHLSALETEMFKVKQDLGELTGSVSIGCTLELATFILAPIVASFKVMHPQVHIDIALQDDAMTVNGVVNGQTDLGLVVFSSEVQLLDIRAFRTERFVTVASRQFIETHGEITDFRQLIETDIVDYHPNCPSMTMWVSKNEKKLLKLLETKTASVSVNDDRLIKHFVMEGLGIANVPRILMEEELEGGDALEILPHAKSISAGIDVISMKDRIFPAQVSAFIQHLKEPIAY